MLPIISRVAVAASVLLAPLLASGQSPAPTLDKQQRATLLGLVTAVKDNPTEPIAENEWPVHLFRASDGSHYVAFSAPAPPALDAGAPLALYVRLTPRRGTGETVVADRSAVEEWLLGERSDPLPMNASRVVQVPSGEMPAGGLAATLSRDGSGQNTATLRLMERQRERAKAEHEERERRRRDQMEGKADRSAGLLPFEDFDMAAHITLDRGQPPAIRRAITAGPGDYDLYLAWAALDSKQRPTTSGVLRRALSLPVTDTSLALGSIVVADDIRVRAEIVRADRQTAHPYAIGATEIVPAADQVFSSSERLSVAFQVMNASPTATGKPDVTVGFRLFRVMTSGEQPAGTLSPLSYDESTLPADFDLTLGHPILAAMAAPLGSLGRGEYRLAITATDRVSRTTATGETRFRIAATPQGLLASAPTLAPSFRRALLTSPERVDILLDLLGPAGRTPALAPIVAAARERRFVELLPEVAVPPTEAGTVTLLQGLGFYALGDNPTAVSLQLRRAIDQGANLAVSRYLMGACLAIEGKDQDAVTEWRAAVTAGLPPHAVAAPMAEAYARLGQMPEAGRVAVAALGQTTEDADLLRMAAAADIADGREAAALERLDPRLAAGEDSETQWLALHALFSGFVKGQGPGHSAAGRARFLALADTYIVGGGRWSALAEEWRALVTSSAP